MSDTTTGMDRSSRWRRRLWLVAGLVAALLVAAVAAVSASTLAWGDTLRTEGRLLPDTTIEAVAVGGETVADATAAVEAVLAAQLDRDITVAFGDTTWSATPRELGATTDLDEVVAAAIARTEAARLDELLRLRWLTGAQSHDLDVTVTVPDQATAAFVHRVAAEVDREPTDAEVTWDGEALQVAEAVAGQQVEVDEAIAALVAAVADEATTTVELPVAIEDAAVSTAAAEQVAATVAGAVSAALDHAVDVTLEGTTRTVTPRELGAVADVEPVLAAASAGERVTAADVPVTITDEALNQLITEVAAGKEVASQNAQIRYAGGDFDITPERTGRAVMRGDARDRLRAALAGASDTVALTLTTVQPRVTAASFDRVLVVSSSERTLWLYRDRQVVRSWPVAVGASSSPTPRGQFVVGAKRYEPTWVNPAPTRWGKDMPPRIGPGPGNPLGLRALNWNNLSGGDTLIRFHGTPNEGSIGSATSNGCVRMFNDDVIELYDLVPSGTTIVSID